ncbi:MAG: SAM-dependent methyltransferase [Acidimicrobiia bacterium]|nr:SAM-dependent methyltransferase [Acidimicrobiia bacterium]MDH4305874.1 SAM-dependent methyltransferase [Acidimicrobiia bacterium]MDH5292268.1 SAM-dependent methyltransferase [Acidimicrobiia bacterium]
MKARLVRQIAAGGPIPFDEFMREALYGDGGFFASAELRSTKSGHFLTSPEVSVLFGETLAVYVGAERDRVGADFGLVEVAGGSGSLLAPLLSALPVPARAVEASPAARAALETIVGADAVFSSLEDLQTPMAGVILANELLDNLPMAIAQLTEAGWRERWVGADDDDLCFVDAPVRPEVGDWLARFAGPVEVGGWVEVQIEAAGWVRRAVRMLDRGSVVLIDYGDVAENLAPRRRDGTLRTYRSHHLGPHPLDEPGATDITADVNFTAMAAAAEEAGASVEIHRQDDFLGAWGLRGRISDMRRTELELARAGDDMQRLAVRTRRAEAETLVHPRGLGDFRVLVARK